MVVWELVKKLHTKDSVLAVETWFHSHDPKVSFKFCVTKAETDFRPQELSPWSPVPDSATPYSLLFSCQQSPVTVLPSSAWGTWQCEAAKGLFWNSGSNTQPFPTVASLPASALCDCVLGHLYHSPSRTVDSGGLIRKQCLAFFLWSPTV